MQPLPLKRQYAEARPIPSINLRLTHVKNNMRQKGTLPRATSSRVSKVKKQQNNMHRTIAWLASQKKQFNKEWKNIGQFISVMPALELADLPPRPTLSRADMLNSILEKYDQYFLSLLLVIDPTIEITDGEAPSSLDPVSVNHIARLIGAKQIDSQGPVSKSEAVSNLFHGFFSSMSDRNISEIASKVTSAMGR